LSNTLGYTTQLTVAATTRAVLQVPIRHMADGDGSEAIDVSRVRGIVIFAAPGNESQVFYILRIQLR
jgi:hypothetical protein